jgi:hypothetical protein
VRVFLKAARRDWQDEGFPVHLSVEGIAYTGEVEEGMNKQRAFRPEELRKLFTALDVAGYKLDAREAHKYWLPYIGLYTGARVNEICQPRSGHPPGRRFRYLALPLHRGQRG